MAKTTVTDAEVSTTQNLSRVLLTMVDGAPPHVSLGALMMASAMYAKIVGIPLENVTSIFDTTAEETYKVMVKGLN